MKNKFLLAFLFLGLLTLNFSCEEESVQVNDEFTLLNHGENKFIQWNNINELPIVNQHLSKLNKQNLQSKSGSNNFTFIEGSRIYVYTDSTEITYTIPIQKEYQLKGTYSNLVIKTIDNNTVESFILNYTPTQEHIEQYANYNQTPYQGTVEYEPLYDEQSPDTQTAGRTSCAYITITYCSWGDEGVHVAGKKCTAEYMWSGTVQVCTDGGGSDDPWGGDPSEPTDVPSGGQDNGGGDDGTDTTPVLESCQELGTCLDDNQVILNCIGPDPRLSRLNDSQKSDIADYIINNRCSIEAQEFTMLAIDALEDDDELDVEKLTKFFDSMDKRCQALILTESILRPQGTPFMNTIKNRFFKRSSNHNLSITNLAPGQGIPPISSSSAAQTSPELRTAEGISDQFALIEFNNNHLDTATNLGIVNTMYHELLHAYIVSLYHEGELLNTYPQYTSLNTAFTNFIEDDTDSIVINNIYQEEMHNIYVDFIDMLANSLLSYAEHNNIDIDLDYAKNLVWGGLNGSRVFDENRTDQQQRLAQTLLGYENSNIIQNAQSEKTCN